MNQKLFPNIIQIFRLGFGQVPVNFPPLTSRWICENYLDTDSDNIVYDMCSGWGGRLLGSLSANRKIHYVGTDVNSNNFGCVLFYFFHKYISLYFLTANSLAFASTIMSISLP